MQSKLPAGQITGHTNQPVKTADVAALADFYLEAGKSENTERAYSSSINHFRFEWGGQLPATADSVRHYLAAFADKLKVSTLRQRLAALSKWHKEQGFQDPTASPLVRKTIRGIAKSHQAKPKQAYPLTFQHLLSICDRLESVKLAAIQAEDQGSILRSHRDLALLLIGFWQGFRSDELSRLEMGNITARREEGISFFLPYSKTDIEVKGSTYDMPALRAYCPTSAYIDWIQVAGIKSGPVFRSITRWGVLAENGINKQSIEHILNRVSAELFPNEPKFSTHSLRRGFADWAVKAGWDMKSLMEHVGWVSADSARRYMPANKDFGALALSMQSGALANEPEMELAGQTLLANYSKQHEGD